MAGEQTHRGGRLMSFSPGQMPIDNEVSRAKVAEAEAKAERYARLHGGDPEPPAPGAIRRGIRRLRSKLSRDPD
jgi:hypothetical protein